MSDKQLLKNAKIWAKQELDKCISFWLENGMDTVNGGVYTCLREDGSIYSTDKSVWMQGRCAWMFAHLCNVYGVKQEWLQASKSCAEFMEKYCINRNKENRMYFTVTEDGKPLRQRRYCFSESFYCIANAELYQVTGEEVYLHRARQAYELIYNLNNNLIQDPTGIGEKTISATRKGRALADPMIYLNTTSILRRVDKEREDLYNKRAKECADQIVKYHYKKDIGCTLEFVGDNGEFFKNISAGRVVNPGHDIECAWFMIEQALYTDDNKLYQDAIEIFDFAVDAGWDKEYGGLLYFIDCLGNPPESYEHDMKLWWPHNELLIASLMIYRDTKNKDYLEWFEKTMQYCKKYFSDVKYGEWYGYLRRDGSPTMPACKGSTFKGPFHVMRSLVMVDQMIDEILRE